MFTALAWLSLAPTVVNAPIPPSPAPIVAAVPAIEGQALPRIPDEFTLYHDVLPLPGQLNNVPVFNSNSPELVQQDGILLSTFPGDEMAHADAHLDFAFEGRFDFFAHHIARGLVPDDRRTLFIGGVIYNPNPEPVTLTIGQGVSYLSQEAPFYNLPALRFNPDGSVFSGPGSRTVADVLQQRRQSQWPRQIVIPPEQTYLLVNAPIPLRRLPFAADATLPPGSILPGAPNNFQGYPVASVVPRADGRPLPSNGRSLLLHLESDGPVYAATLAMYAPRTDEGEERAPTLQEWLRLLVNGRLAGPRDIPPTNPEEYAKSDEDSRFFYGRVAGVAQGSQWEARAVDEEDADYLTIPAAGEAVSYVISTVDYNTFGTSQIQSAPMLARYSDTAYRAHGNYGVHYKIRLPLHNATDRPQRIALSLQTPLQDETLKHGLRFLRNPVDRIFFRGTVRVQYETETGQQQTRYIHVVQRQGEEGEPLLRLALPPNAQQNVTVELIYPPDATPPQVLTLETLGNASARTRPPATVESAPVSDVDESADSLSPVPPATTSTTPLPVINTAAEVTETDATDLIPASMDQFLAD
ncbi:DUF3370 domain-containing protein [Leptolyngbya iicbica]|uniref:DUF3370 domain-containing protein n=2 Tax=Cyanophyceae TaxID=3028117 RepID=A0A4Q7EIH8_9CYAN|nr:DUF3370 domain-containing protein [Leptolyngbya sp. LK]RZM82916.1 DUF3370 domain-containing protein [Leptolyngbya sp. LK]